MSKFDIGYVDANFEEGDLIALVEDTTLSTVNYTSSKGIELTFDTDVEEKIMCFDHDKIERVLLNLLSNAIKFSQEGASIFVEVIDRGEQVSIRISDTGIGIPEDKIKDIFERFVQLDRSLTRAHEGSGIGLSLVKSLVEMHKGQVFAESVYGEGSKFTITIPTNLKPTRDSKISEATIKDEKVKKVDLEFSDIA
jgi:signal transduction histidine kinase